LIKGRISKAKSTSSREQLKARANRGNRLDLSAFADRLDECAELPGSD
jgi:hypothetical protein